MYPLLPRHCALLNTFGCEALSTQTCVSKKGSSLSLFRLSKTTRLFLGLFYPGRGVSRLTLLPNYLLWAKLSLIAAKPTRILPIAPATSLLHTFWHSLLALTQRHFPFPLPAACPSRFMYLFKYF